MDRQRQFRDQPVAKVLIFPPVHAVHPDAATLATTNAANANVAASARRMLRLDHYFVRAWSLLAWVLAAYRVQLAASHHEVFGAEATLAFVVAVALPLLRVGHRVTIVSASPRGLSSQS